MMQTFWAFVRRALYIQTQQDVIRQADNDITRKLRLRGFTNETEEPEEACTYEVTCESGLFFCPKIKTKRIK